MSEPFAKLFDTPHGQLLAYLDDDDEERPCINVIGAPVRGVRAKAKMSYDDEDGQLRGFDNIDQALAEKTAATLYETADRYAQHD